MNEHSVRIAMIESDGLAEGCWTIPADVPPMPNVMQLVWSSLGIANDPGDTFELGSCFMVSNSIAVTATHCIDHVKDLLARDGVRHPSGEYKFNLGVLQRDSGLGLKVVRFSTLEGTEFTLLHLERDDSQAQFPLPEPLLLRTNRLRSDEPLFVLGFAQQEVYYAEQESIDAAQKMVYLHAKPVIGVGRVEDKAGDFLIGTSIVRILGVEAMPGMSGGPVLDEAGRAIGLVSRSLGGGGYTDVVRWSLISPEIPALPREYVGETVFRMSDRSEICLWIHNAD